MSPADFHYFSPVFFLFFCLENRAAFLHLPLSFPDSDCWVLWKLPLRVYSDWTHLVHEPEFTLSKDPCVVKLRKGYSCLFVRTLIVSHLKMLFTRFSVSCYTPCTHSCRILLKTLPWHSNNETQQLIEMQSDKCRLFKTTFKEKSFLTLSLTIYRS